MWSGVLTENYLQWLCHSFSMLAVSTNEIFGDATKLSGPQLHKNELWSTTWYSWIVISQVESVTSNQQPRDSEAAHILWFSLSVWIPLLLFFSSGLMNRVRRILYYMYLNGLVYLIFHIILDLMHWWAFKPSTSESFVLITKITCTSAVVCAQVCTDADSMRRLGCVENKIVT